jgi:hypothetical protein
VLASEGRCAQTTSPDKNEITRTGESQAAAPSCDYWFVRWEGWWEGKQGRAESEVEKLVRKALGVDHQWWFTYTARRAAQPAWQCDFLLLWRKSVRAIQLALPGQKECAIRKQKTPSVGIALRLIAHSHLG